MNTTITRRIRFASIWRIAKADYRLLGRGYRHTQNLQTTTHDREFGSLVMASTYALGDD